MEFDTPVGILHHVFKMILKKNFFIQGISYITDDLPVLLLTIIITTIWLQYYVIYMGCNSDVIHFTVCIATNNVKLFEFCLLKNRLAMKS